VIYLVYTLHVVVCLFLILVVLLQQGKGADLSVFGGGSTQAAFGARGAATLLHKMTVAGFVAFIFTTISIGFLQGGGRGGSVMSTVVEEPAPLTTETPTEAPTFAGEELPATAAEAPSEPMTGDEGESAPPTEESEPPGGEQ
jgi:preprotein translocase subunit SecG